MKFLLMNLLKTTVISILITNIDMLKLKAITYDKTLKKQLQGAIIYSIGTTVLRLIKCYSTN